MQHCPPVTLHGTALVQHTPVILIPPNVSLSNTVTQSLTRSLSLSICQSAVSHSLIQSVPRLLCLSASRSCTRSMPLSWFAHLPPHSLTWPPPPTPTPPSSTVHVLVLPGFSLYLVYLVLLDFARAPCASNRLSVLFYLALSNLLRFWLRFSSTSWLHVAFSTSDSLPHFIFLHIFLMSLLKISLSSKSPTLTVTLQASTWLTSRPSIRCQAGSNVLM